MDLTLLHELAAVDDLRHRVRRLGWFRASFGHALSVTAAQAGLDVAVEPVRLTAAFLDWMEAFCVQRPFAADAPADFTAFAGGLLLRELVRHDPARVTAGAARAGPPAIWPQGFLYTTYCVNVVAAVADRDFQRPLDLSPAADDARVWASFREGAREDPALAIGFLDVFLGNAPNWTQPAWAPARPGRRSVLPALAPA